MCGIIGYFGKRNAVQIGLECLKKLEYRGYDSWGIAAKNERINVLKKIGKIGLVDVNKTGLPSTNLAILHTRWSTHGAVTEKNAHPQASCDKKIAIVHNGIIENYQDLRQELIEKGHKFVSETDTETIPHLIEEYMKKYDFLTAFKKMLSRLEGRYAILAIHAQESKILAARKGSPLVIGLGEDETIIASDIPAFLSITNKVIFLDDNELAIVDDNLKITDIETGKEARKKVVQIEWNSEEAEKGDYDHFMIKEIMEQKESIRRAINQDDKIFLDAAKMINNAFGTYFVGCGTAGKVCLTGTYLFSRICDKHVNFAVGSEFPNYHHFLTDKSLVVGVSQSGETADTLEAIEVAKRKKGKIASIINAIGTTMERQSDMTIMVKAGPEKCVASTKVTTGQLAIITLLAYACAGRLQEGKTLLTKASKEINEMLDEKYLENVRELAEKIKHHESMYVIGRSLSYPIALEAAIKLQEISYIHAEGFAGGELKHGPIALISKGIPVIAIVPNDETKKDTLSNAIEIKSRGGYIIGIAPENNEIFDYWLKIPDVGNASPIASIIPVQILSYYLGVLRGNDIDHPRNLAKSVTVK